MLRRGDVREPGVVQRRHEKVAGSVAREPAAGPVGAVSGRSQAHEQQRGRPGRRIQAPACPSRCRGDARASSPAPRVGSRSCRRAQRSHDTMDARTSASGKGTPMASVPLSAGCGSDDRRFTRGTADSTIRSWIDDHEVACVTRLRRMRPSSKGSRRASGSSRSITCSSLAGPPGSAVCSDVLAGSRSAQRRQAPLHGQYPLHQHHLRGGTADVSRQPGDRAADQEPRAVERAGDGGQGQQARRWDWRSYLDVRVGGDACTRSA